MSEQLLGEISQRLIPKPFAHSSTLKRNAFEKRFKVLTIENCVQTVCYFLHFSIENQFHLSLDLVFSFK